MTRNKISSAREAARITSDGFLFLRTFVRPGMTEQQVANALRAYFRASGYSHFAFRFIIATGRNAATPHHWPTRTQLRHGHGIVCDFGVRVQGISADMTRMLFLGAPSSRQARMYRLILEAQRRVVRRIRAGFSARAADAIARSHLKRHGFDSRIFCHSTGHGVGRNIHQPPWLSPKKKDHALQEHAIITVEPGLYFKGRDGYRIEDMYLITKHGSMQLTSAPEDLKDCIIQ